MSTLGKYIWFDLATSDTASAIAFYGESIGWKSMAWDEGDKPYTMFTMDGTPVAGLMDLPEELKAMKVPPHWIGYVEVEDVDAIVQQATELGGTVHKAGFDIPTVGRIAVLADPQGAAFAVFAPSEEKENSADRSELGTMSWSELNTSDYEAGWKFYSALFGWEATESMDMGPEGTYFMFKWKGSDTSMGGMSNVAKSMGAPPHWLHYTNVDNIEAAVDRITKAGGKIVNGPMEVPGGSMIAQCMDPQGAAFAIHALVSG